MTCHWLKAGSGKALVKRAALLLAPLFVACGSEPAPEPAVEKPPIRAAFVYFSAPGDLGWTYAHEQGRLAAQSAIAGVETTRIENVPEDASSEAVIESLATKGYDIIFTTSFGYHDPTFAVAQRHPNVKFEHCSGSKTLPNMSVYFGRIEQARYLNGIVAARKSKTVKLGYVAAFPIPEVVRGINAFTLGARSVNPSATVEVKWSNSWFDPAVEGQNAEALLNAGADVLAQHQDSTATINAAKERGAFAIGYNSDMLSVAPGTVLTSAVWNWGSYYKSRIQAVKDGTWVSHSYWGSMGDGIAGLGAYGEGVPADVRAEVAAVQKRIEDGTLNVFAGPMSRQDGTSWVASGQAIPDSEQLSMMTFVQGVIGTLP